MVNEGNNVWVAYISGTQMGGQGQHWWSIVGKDNSTGGTTTNGVAAAPKNPPGELWVYSNNVYILPVDENNNPDKNPMTQWGNGLRVSPEDTTTPNDGGSSHYYTWRVRVVTQGGLPLQYMQRRDDPVHPFEWRNTAADYPNKSVTAWNSGLILVLVDPQGNTHYCPMEIDPDSARNQSTGISDASTYTTETGGNDNLLHPTGNDAWSQNEGVVYRYRMLPTDYPGRNYGGPSVPYGWADIYTGSGWYLPDVVARPFSNRYTAFARSPLVYNGSFPNITGVAGLAGQWRYYFIANTTMRAVSDISQNNYPSDNYGQSTAAYSGKIYNYGSVNGGTAIPPASVADMYQHPRITPILSDGGWTDDLPDNQALQPIHDDNFDPLKPGNVNYSTTNDTLGPAHRTRATTRTKVRFMVKVTKDTQTVLPAQAVRVWIDGTAHSMQPFYTTAKPSLDYINGQLYYYDTSFPEGQEGGHWYYFDCDDGYHHAIWPRRDTSTNGTGDTRFRDTQGENFGVTYQNAVDFGTLTVGKNFMTGPYVNHRPKLTNPTVTPNSGVESQAFTYEVTYTDADGSQDAPIDAYVFIDGDGSYQDLAHRHRMTLISDPATTNAAQGWRYRFTLTSLVPTPNLKHTFYYQFRDDWNGEPTRPEYGEWVTLPSGDDFGNPSSQIEGPFITGNHPPEMTEPGILASDAANTSATMYDFVVSYLDADGNPPAYVKMYLSDDNGATWSYNTTLVPADNSQNYTTGVQYHMPTLTGETRPGIRLLPVGATNANGGTVTGYRIKFLTSDGTLTNQEDPKTPAGEFLIHVGASPDPLKDNTAHTFVPFGGSTSVFVDPVGSFLWSANPSYKPRIWRAGIEQVLGTGYTVNATTGQITLNPVNTTGDAIRGSYYYEQTAGPNVKANKAPTLAPPDSADYESNYKTLSPLEGPPNTQFTYKVVYTDLDNQAPKYVNLIIDGNSSSPRAMQMDPSTPNPPDFSKGITYVLTTTLASGSHNYHFEATDGRDVARFLDTVAANNPTNPATGQHDDRAELPGPNVRNIGSLGNPKAPDVLITPFPKGPEKAAYMFTVLYSNPDGLAPIAPVELRITTTGATPTTTKLTMNAVDAISPTAYTNGVRYQLQLRAGDATVPNNPLLNPGDYKITFGFQNRPDSTDVAPQTLTINTQPVLSNATWGPQPGASQSGQITFSVTYTDAEGTPPAQPSAVALWIDSAARTEAPVTSPASPTAADYKAGVKYTWTLPANQFTVGTHRYYFAASDDIEAAVSQPAPVPPGGNFSVTGPHLPVLVDINNDTTGASDFSPNVRPAPRNTAYTFSITYKHPDNAAPTRMQVIVDNGATPLVGNMATTGTDYLNGVTYTFQTAPGALLPGPHTFHFEAVDEMGNQGTTLLPATGSYSGPVVNDPATLANGTIYAVGSTPNFTLDANNALNPPIVDHIGKQYVFEVTYTDLDNVAPDATKGLVQVKVNGRTLNLAPKAGDALNWKNGVVFVTAPQTITPAEAGAQTFHFEANDGIEPTNTKYPATGDITGVTLKNIATLIDPTPGSPTTNNGTMTPALGAQAGIQSQAYTFKVRYQHLDGTAPTAIRLLVDQGTPEAKQVDLQPTSGTPTAADFQSPTGVEYSYQFAPGSFQGGKHTYQFTASDPLYTALDPATGSPLYEFTINWQPALSQPTAYIQGTTPGSTPDAQLQLNPPITGHVLDKYIFRVTYSDLDKVAPAAAPNGFVRVHVIANGKTTDINLAPVGTPKPDDYAAGVVYESAPTTLESGAQTFYFDANDGIEGTRNPQGTSAIGGLTVKNVAQLIEPAPNTPGSNNGTMLPALNGQTAIQNQPYDFKVIYKHLDGTAPNSINLVLDPGTASAKTIALNPTTGTPDAAAFQAGVEYSATAAALSTPGGAHTYRFEAADGLYTATLPTSGTYSFTMNWQPVLSGGTVYVSENPSVVPTLDKNNALTPTITDNTSKHYVFRVTYQDKDGVAPAGAGFIRASLNGGAKTIDLKPVAGSSDYTTGVVYQSDPTTLAAGTVTFHFEANDGIEANRFPASAEISGLTIKNVPVLLPIDQTPGATDDGTLAPRNGPISTTFTYQVVYQQGDNVAPKTIRVFIDGTPYDMTKTGTATSYATGVTYQYAHKFPATTTVSSHTYHFEAVDNDPVNAAYTARYPSTGETSGPLINTAELQNLAFNPTPGTLAAPVNLVTTGAAPAKLMTSPALGTAQPVVVTLTKPDGTVTTANLVTNADGTLPVYSFTPDQTGAWTAQFRWAGVPGQYDAVTRTVNLNVTGYVVSLDAGVWDMISTPMIPARTDPAGAFGVNDLTGAPLTISAINLTRWVPTGSSSGAYAFLNTSPGFPAIAAAQSFWVFPTRAVKINPSGSLYDQTKTYTLPLSAGWNMIGSVYLNSINWGAVKVRSQGQVMSISDAGSVVRPIAWGYDKTSGSYRVVGVDNTLETGRGYWLRALQDCELILPVPGTRAETTGRDVVQKESSLQIVARSGNKADTDNYAPLLTSGKSRMVLMEKPPYMADHVSVQFLPNENLPAGDSRAAAAQNVVMFQVETDHQNADVTLQFPNASALGRKYEISLVDLANNTSRTVAGGSGYTYNSGDNAAPRRFALLMNAATLNSRLVITGLSSDQSRASGTMTFSYGLSGSASVRAQIVSGTGRVVRSLVQGRAATVGTNVLTWDGKDNQGTSLPAGVYILRLTAADDNGHTANAVLPIMLSR